MNMTKKFLAALALGCASVASALAQPSYPDKSIRLVVGFGPGSGADTIARVVAERLADRLKVSVIVENREGAGGSIGTTAVAKATADGYTLLLGASPMTVTPHMQATPAYDPVKDFVPIIRVAELPLLLITNPNAPYNNLKELVAYAKQNPGKLSYATSGMGSPSHLSVEMIKQSTGINVVSVPYKNVGQAMTDTLAGTVSFYVPAIPGALPQVKAGKARGLALGALRRSSKLPDVPTLSEELGAAGLEVITWYGVLAPAGTPREITAKLYAEIAKVMDAPETREKLAATGVDVSVTNSDEFAAQVRADNTRYGKLVRELGLKE
jgi:tripartite-type tricarboxylate transporter receptor subunit TctC